MTPEYPMIECDAHPGEREPGYMVCQHVLAGEPIGHLERANEKSLGVVCCAACHARRDDQDYVLDHFVVSCAAGMREKGLLAST